MKKIPLAIISILALTTLVVLTSGAWFTGSANTESRIIQAGTLDLGLELKEIPEAGGTITGDETWIPGDYQQIMINISNKGSLASRWRLGIIPNQDYSTLLADEMVLSFFCQDENGGWKLIRSDRLSNLLVEDETDNWLYDEDLALAKGIDFQAIEPGESLTFLMEVEFEMTAMADLQGEKFNGNIVLQGAQVNDESWFPSAEVDFNVNGGDE
ncbi:MAG: hypothetical protein PHT79_01290 [Syntrophomonadaceae bacterium]|nr:hypothetical protein [Syntrophomonadaceae bacterium]